MASDATVTGHAYETFVAMELARLLPCTKVEPTVYHWRGRHGEEVDVVLEDRRGRVVAIEIKAGATVGRDDIRWLTRFRSLLGERFMAGLVLCTTHRTLPLGRDIWAVPIEALWDERCGESISG